MKYLKSRSGKVYFDKTLFVILSLIFFSVATAQDKQVEIDIGVNKEPVWYQQPWTWVVGAAIFILLLVAILRGSKKT